MANKKQETKNTNKKNVKKTETKKVSKEVVKESKSNKEVKLEENNKNVKEERVSKKNKNEIPKFFEYFDKYRQMIYGIVGGVLATLFVVMLVWPDRIAKLENGKEPVAEIEGFVVTAEDLYEDMKNIYSVSNLLDKIDNKILEEKYPETEEMNEEVKETAENYYNVYEQYYGTTKEEFLSSNGFGSEAAFLEYLKLQYRRNKYSEDYVKSLVTENEVNDFYEKEVYGDINTKHMLVRVDSSATEEEKKEAENLAKEIISKLDEGKTFDELKEEYKDKITYEELGYKSYNASLESAYMKEMESLSNESYSKTPVKTSYGYHVVYRIDQKEKPAIDDVKEEIIDSLAATKSSEDTNLNYIALDKMRTEAGIKFHDTVLEKKYNIYIEQYK